MEDFPVYTLLKFPMAAIVTQAIKILQVILHFINQLTEKKSGEEPESVQTTRTICPEAKPLEYLMQGWLWYGAGYVNTVLETAPYSDADSFQTALSHKAPLPYHGYPLLERAYRPGFDYSRVQEKKAKFLLTALLGNMQEWVELVARRVSVGFVDERLRLDCVQWLSATITDTVFETAVTERYGVDSDK